MSNLVKKIHCDYHADKTASMAVYDDGSMHCFGCGKHIIGEIPLGTTTPKVVEDLEGTLKKIRTLPTKDIRGLTLHYDDNFYYIQWPDGSFYKKRLWKADSNNKYRGPVGHRKPLFVADNKTPNLLLVEGEINAATVMEHAPIPYCLASPGPATDFMRKEYLQYYLEFDRIAIVVDKDAAGVCAGLELKAYLQQRKKRVSIYPVEEDFNEVYLQKGKQGLHEEVNKAMALFRMR